MAGQIRITTTFEITDPYGNVLEPIITRKTVEAITALDVRHYAITADQTRTLYDPTVEATENMSDFDGLAMWADGVLDVEFTANEGDANETLDTKRLVADLPLMLGADDSYYNGGLAGTLDVIDKIRVDEPDTAARTLHLIMWKV